MILKIDRFNVIRVISFVTFYLMAFNLFATESETAPLVKIRYVKSWPAGLIDTLQCQVQVPHSHTFSSQSNARLIFSLPTGTQVAKGDLIAQQDDAYIKLTIQSLKHQLIQHTASVKFNEQELERNTQLGAPHVSPSELNELQLETERARQNRSIIQTQLEAAQLRFEALSHFAPESGEVGALFSPIDSVVNQGNPIVQFIATSQKEIRCDLPLARYKQLDSLESSTFYIGQNEALYLNRASEILSENRQAFSLYLSPRSSLSASYFIGELVSVEMRTPLRELALVPTESLIIAKGQNHVLRVNAAKKIEKLPVQLIKNQNDYFLVKAKVNAGDQLVSLGQSQLKEGQQVRVFTAPDAQIRTGE